MGRKKWPPQVIIYSYEGIAKMYYLLKLTDVATFEPRPRSNKHEMREMHTQ